MFVAIGYSKVNRARSEVFRRCQAKGYKLASYMSTRASNYGPTDLGENSFVFEDNVIQPFVEIGSNVVIWSGNHVGHHSIIEDHCFVASHAVISGRVKVGRQSFIGVNSTIANGVTIGAENIIGAGALITRDTQDREVYRPVRTQPASVSSEKLWR